MPPDATPTQTRIKRAMSAPTSPTASPPKKKARVDATMLLHEIIPRKRMKYVLREWDEFVAHFANAEDCRNHKDIKKGLQQTLAMLKGDVLKVSYKADGGGRFVPYPFYSLQNIPRPIRHFLCRGLYYDIDIECAAPTFFAQYGAKNGLPVMALQCYKDQCKQMRQDLADALLPRIEGESEKARRKKAMEDAKFYINVVLTGGYVRREVTRALGEENWVGAIRNECQAIGAHLETARPDLWERAEEAAGEEGWNVQGKAAARLYREWEARVLLILVDGMKKRGLLKVTPEEAARLGAMYELKKTMHICAAIHDGAQAPIKEKGAAFPAEAIRGLEEDVYEGTTYSIKLKEKAFDEGPRADEEDLEEDEVEDGELDEEVQIKGGNREAAQIVLRRIKGKALVSNGETFVENKGLWTSKPAVVKTWFIRRVMRANLYMINNSGHEVRLTNDIGHTKKIIETLMAHLPEVDNFMELVRESTRGKILFQDGYWDCEEGCFVEGFEGVVGVVRINRPFPRMEAGVYEEILGEIKRRIIYPIWGREGTEQGREWELLRLYLIRALAGHVEDKQWGVGTGLRNSGKGVLMQLLMRGFDGYVTAVGSNNFLSRGNDFGGDEAKKLSWIKSLQYVRLCITSEMRQTTGGKPSVIDGDMMKMLCNGGEDPVQMRTNHQDEVIVYIACLFLLLANDLPDVSPPDAYETMLAFKFNRKFIPEDEFVDKFGAGGSSNKFSIADDTIKAFCRRREVLDAFVMYLIAGYKGDGKVVPSESMRAHKADLQPETEEDRVQAFFCFTGQATDYTPVSVIKEKLAEHKLGIQYPAFKMMADMQNSAMDVSGLAAKKRCPGVGPNAVAVLYGVKYVAPAPHGHGSP